jgi:hypothetical protein
MRTKKDVTNRQFKQTRAIESQRHFVCFYPHVKYSMTTEPVFSDMRLEGKVPRPFAMAPRGSPTHRNDANPAFMCALRVGLLLPFRPIRLTEQHGHCHSMKLKDVPFMS